MKSLKAPQSVVLHSSNSFQSRQTKVLKKALRTSKEKKKWQQINSRELIEQLQIQSAIIANIITSPTLMETEPAQMFNFNNNYPELIPNFNHYNDNSIPSTCKPVMEILAPRTQKQHAQDIIQAKIFCINKIKYATFSVAMTQIMTF